MFPSKRQKELELFKRVKFLSPGQNLRRDNEQIQNMTDILKDISASKRSQRFSQSLSICRQTINALVVLYTLYIYIHA